MTATEDAFPGFIACYLSLHGICPHDSSFAWFILLQCASCPPSWILDVFL